MCMPWRWLCQQSSECQRVLCPRRMLSSCWSWKFYRYNGGLPIQNIVDGRNPAPVIDYVFHVNHSIYIQRFILPIGPIVPTGAGILPSKIASKWLWISQRIPFRARQDAPKQDRPTWQWCFCWTLNENAGDQQRGNHLCHWRLGFREGHPRSQISRLGHQTQSIPYLFLRNKCLSGQSGSVPKSIDIYSIHLFTIAIYVNGNIQAETCSLQIPGSPRPNNTSIL